MKWNKFNNVQRESPIININTYAWIVSRKYESYFTRVSEKNRLFRHAVGCIILLFIILSIDFFFPTNRVKYPTSN